MGDASDDTAEVVVGDSDGGDGGNPA
jgi:hypothetical protein